ncbi:hypothetical protein D6D18_10042 [Aureobasidium pullulans]|nr:hypothetical protein D6D18_10042 [Aureobasidium pullulans]
MDCCAVKLLFGKRIKAVCNTKIKGSQNIPCNNCFLRFKENQCVPDESYADFLKLDTNARFIFNGIMRAKSEGQTDKFLQQRGWFLDDLDAAINKIFSTDRTQTQSRASPAAKSTDWPENMPVVISLSGSPENAMVDPSGTSHLPVVQSVTCSDSGDGNTGDTIDHPAGFRTQPAEHVAYFPVTHAYTHHTTHVDKDSYSRRSVDSHETYRSGYSGYSKLPVEIYEDSFFRHEERVSYERFERSGTRFRTRHLKEIKKTVRDLLNGLHIR